MNEKNDTHGVNTIVVKENLPKFGIVSTHPERTQRIKQYLSDVKLHTEYWGTTIYTGKYNGAELFIGCVPMGSAGGGAAILEMYLRGAEYIIRYGSNDYRVQEFTEEDFRKTILVTEADNLRGLMYDSGAPMSEIGESIKASPLLLEKIRAQAKALNIKTIPAVCHNADDYHAFNYPNSELFKANAAVIEERRLLRESKYPGQTHTCDMETGALFWRAKQTKNHAATVLQTIIKHSDGRAYEGKFGEISKEMEQQFCRLLLGTLSSMATEMLSPTKLGPPITQV